MTAHNTPSEAMDFLLSVLRAEQPVWPGNPPAGFASSVEKLIYLHGLNGLVYRQYEGNPAWKQWPDDLRNKVKRTAVIGSAHQLYIKKEIHFLLSSLAKEKIPVLLLKGAALAFTQYPHPEMRSMGDIDMLFRRQDLARALEVIESCGYHFIYRQGFLGQEFSYNKNDVAYALPLDLHWRLSSYVVLAHVLDFDEMWQAAGTFPGEAEIPCILSPEHALLHACVHLAKHQALEDTTRLLWLFDIHLLCEQLGTQESQEFIDLCIDKKLTQVILDVLLQLSTRLPGKRLDNLIKQLSGISQKEPSSRLLYNNFRSFLLKDIFALQSGRAVFRSLQDIFFPPAAYMLKLYQRKNKLWLPWLYTHRLLSGLRKYLFH